MIHFHKISNLIINKHCGKMYMVELGLEASGETLLETLLVTFISS
jgi:hypothetical protein